MTQLERARAYLALGLNVIPLNLRKKPAIKWKVFQTARATDADLVKWFGGRQQRNLAIATGPVSGVVVVESDTPEAEAWCKANLPHTPMQTQSARGVHRYYAHPPIDDVPAFLRVGGLAIEVKRQGQYAVAPGSIHPTGHVYAEIEPWPTSLDVLPILPASVFATTATTKIARSQTNEPVRHGLTIAQRREFATRYLEHCEPAIQGDHGDDRTYQVCCAVTNDYDLSPSDALDVLRQWNARCQPPWPEHELLTKLEGTARGANGPRGSKLDFARDKHGDVVPNSQHNIRLALAKMRVRLAFNAFALRVEIVLPDGRVEQMSDDAIVPIWLAIDARFHFRPARNLFDAVILADARRSAYHPILDYLSALRWDGTKRLDNWLTTYGGAKSTAFTRAVGAIVLIAAVRRVRQPGVKFDELLIWEADQGRVKSQAVNALCPNDDWFSDDLPLGVDAKQVIERTSGKWIVEAGELHGQRQREAEYLKSFLSRRRDGPVRLAYERLSKEVPRQFLLIGTTNKYTGYLSDSTGNRRFWPVRVEQFDLARLIADRDQLWAEAAHREAAGESIHLDSSLWAAAGREQEDRRLVDPWEELILDEIVFDEKPDTIAAADIWTALGSMASQRDNRHAQRVADIMTRLGYPVKRRVRTREQVNSKTMEARKTLWCRAGVELAEQTVLDLTPQACDFDDAKRTVARATQQPDGSRAVSIGRLRKKNDEGDDGL
jgi:predicted P-loop ATPase